MKTKDNKSIQLNDKTPLLQQLLNSEVSNRYANLKVLKGWNPGPLVDRPLHGLFHQENEH